MGSYACPYCDEDLRLPEDCYSEGRVYTDECSNCEKKFVFTIEYSVDYYTHQAECLNGASHKFVKRCGCPEYVFAGKYKCSDCDEEKYDKQEAIQEIDILLSTLPSDHWERRYIEVYRDGLMKQQQRESGNER